MFRSLMTIIRELYLYLTKVIFMLKHSVKLRLYIYIYTYIYTKVIFMLKHSVKLRLYIYIHIYKDVILPSVLT